MIALWQERQMDTEGHDLSGGFTGAAEPTEPFLPRTGASCRPRVTTSPPPVYPLPLPSVVQSPSAPPVFSPSGFSSLKRASRTGRSLKEGAPGRCRGQQTLADEALISGIGLHSGRVSNVRVSPAAANAGLRFERTDLKAENRAIEGRFDLVSDTLMCTKVSNGKGAELGTVEHLLSALRALEIDNAVISVDGPEIPVLDGSAVQIYDVLRDAGVVGQRTARQVIRILEPVCVGDDSCGASLRPGPGFALDFTIRYESAAIGEQKHSYRFDAGTYADEIGGCRTFGFFEDVEHLRRMGLAKGGSLDNAVVIKDGAVMNPGGLRHADEFVRHKILDAMGDLYLAGLQIEGKYEGICSGHRINNQLLHALFDQPSAWVLAYQEEAADDRCYAASDHTASDRTISDRPAPDYTRPDHTVRV